MAPPHHVFQRHNHYIICAQCNVTNPIGLNQRQLTRMMIGCCRSLSLLMRQNLDTVTQAFFMLFFFII